MKDVAKELRNLKGMVVSRDFVLGYLTSVMNKLPSQEDMEILVEDLYYRYSVSVY